MVGADAQGFVVPAQGELTPLPKGSTFLYLPGHNAVGWDQKQDALVRIREFDGQAALPAAAFLIPGFTRTYLPAAEKIDKDIMLPLWPYTAVGYLKGRFYAAALLIDKMRRQRPFYYERLSVMKKNIKAMAGGNKANRLLKHLSRCALVYNCRNAQNLFLKRWEAPLPVSPACNSRCLGCLSFQGSDCAQASHERIGFVPSPEEIFEVGFPHLKYGRQPMVSFGQGCEGEPLLQFKLLKTSIGLIRRGTARGTVHLNTNGFDPGHIQELARAGLDSVRISINSFRAASYNAYYRPGGYIFDDVLDSIKISRKSGLFVSLNYLVFPGFSDSAQEVKKLISFLKKGYVDLLQLRNLSIDPDFFGSAMPKPDKEALGVAAMIFMIRKECPGLRLGYFNLPREKF